MGGSSEARRSLHEYRAFHDWLDLRERRLVWGDLPWVAGVPMIERDPVVSAFLCLPEECRQAFVLALDGRSTYREIAHLTGRSPEQVTHDLNTGLAQIAAALRFGARRAARDQL